MLGCTVCEDDLEDEAYDRLASLKAHPANGQTAEPPFHLVADAVWHNDEDHVTRGEN